MKWSDKQLEAIQKENTNILVSAGAGSGKTAVLTERVINKLRNKSCHINDLLILTFTNDAAAEMKSRISAEIRKDPLLKEEEELLDLAYITTFDSYALSVLKKYSYLLNIDKNIKVLDDVILKYLMEKIIDDVFMEYYDANNQRFLDFIKDFAVKDDNQVKGYITKLYFDIDLIIDKETYFKKFKEDIPSKFDEYYETLKNIIVTKFRRLIEEAEEKEYLYRDPLTDLFAFKDATELNEIASIRGVKLPLKAVDLTEEEGKLKDAFNKKNRDLAGEAGSFSDKELLRNEYLLSFKHLDIILEIIENLSQKLMAKQKEYNSYTFTSIAKMAVKLFKEYPEVREEESRFKEIMVDEYQDTSDVQEIFLSYISHNNMYMVGDIKQSIYAFRYANPTLFKTKYEAFSKGDGGIKIDLNDNYRSRSEVTGPINELFNEIMTLDLGGAAYQKDHQIVSSNKIYEKGSNNYDLEVLSYNSEEIKNKNEFEIKVVIQKIKELIDSKMLIFDKELKDFRPIEYRDITIIKDRKGEFDNYKEAFTEAGIPLYINADKNIEDNLLYLLIKNIYILLKGYKENNFNNDFNYAYTSILRSFLFEKQDDKIYKDVKNQTYDEDLLARLDVIDYVDGTIKESLEKLLISFNIYEKISKIGNINEAMSIIDYLLNLADALGNISMPLDQFPLFLDYLVSSNVEVKMQPQVESENSVNIINIHKSKGLEYPVCFFTGLTKGFNYSDMTDKLIFDKDFGLILPYVDNRKQKYTVMRYAYLDRYKRAFLSEEIRLFYVALTRAREKMIILYDTKPNNVSLIDTKNFNNLLKFNPLIKSYMHDIDLKEIVVEENSKLVNTEALKIEIKDYLKEYHLKDIKRASKELKVTGEDISKILDLGTHVHELFEYIDFKTKDLSLLTDEEKAYVQPFLNLDLGFDKAKIYKEYEFIMDDEDLTRGVIDLLLEYDDHIKIIDYKLKNTKDEEYLNQLKTYKNYIERISNKKVTCYLYSVLNKSLEEISI